MKRPSVYVCRGSSCRKRKELPKILKLLSDEDVSFKNVRCQKICKGPVVGFDIDGKVNWFKRLRDKKTQRALVVWFRESRLKKSMRKHRVDKRKGKLL